MKTYKILNSLKETVKTLTVKTIEEVEDAIYDLKAYHGFNSTYTFEQVQVCIIYIKMKKEIKFITTPFKHNIDCYYKENGWDIYLNGQCIKTCASRLDIQMMYKLLGKENEVNED